MVNHYKVFVNFQDIKHQLQEDILYHFPQYYLLQNFHEIEKYLLSIQNYLLEAFVKLYNTTI